MNFCLLFRYISSVVLELSYSPLIALLNSLMQTKYRVFLPYFPAMTCDIIHDVIQHNCICIYNCSVA